MLRPAAVFITLAFFSVSPAFAVDRTAPMKRVALVIGNSDYDTASDLANPRHDAADIAHALRALGFEVELREDLDLSGMIGALGRLRRNSVGATQALVYYAGHGVEADGENFLVPVDAALRGEGDERYQTTPLRLVTEAVASAEELGIVVLDACRDYPFPRATRGFGGGAAGLRPFEPADGVLVAYAAKGGTAALDGSGRNSPYAAAFLEALGREGLDVGKLFRRVRDTVRAGTGGVQEPYLYGSLPERDIYLNRPQTSRPNTNIFALNEPRPSPVPAVPAWSAIRSASRPAQAVVEEKDEVDVTEVVYWDSIRLSEDPQAFRDFLGRFPDGVFYDLATQRLMDLPLETPLAPGEDGGAAAVAAAKPLPAPAGPPTREELRAMQAKLNDLGHEAGEPDGIIGRRTRNALRSWQSKAGLPVTGMPDDEALIALGVRAAAAAKLGEPDPEPIPMAPPSRPIYGHEAAVTAMMDDRIEFEITGVMTARAALPGTVTAVSLEHDGFAVTVTSPGGASLRYHPLRSAEVAPGDAVPRGQILGRVGGVGPRPRPFTLGFTGAAAFGAPTRWF